jgi:predicted NACHT family NTPase
MSDPATELTGKVAANIITEIFKTTLLGVKEAKEWLKDKNKEYDVFGLAAKRYAEKLEERYNSIHIFGMTKPVPLRTIFTQVNILEKVTARHRATVEELQQFFDRDLRNFGRVVKTREGIEAINDLDKIVVLGKPGAGKTTFLKYLTLQALDGNLMEKLIPIFVSLKEWSESSQSLNDFIVDQFEICDFPNATLFVSRMLSNGKCLLLLDGFDEVSHTDVEDVVKDIRRLATKYSKNKFVLSCRIAAYNYFFEKFTEVEIADFTSWQIETFVNNWFGKGTSKARGCLKEISENRPIRELANIPLLLTMLCLTFDETMGFPANRAELYKEALDALLKKWDSSRSIKRDDIYRHLSLRRRESMFSRVAAITFENNQYFIPQRKLEKHIAIYIQNLPEAKEDTINLDSGAILKSIEAQHGIFVERAKGIYSFSHLTFQEYFTSQYLVEYESKGTLRRLVEDHLITGTSDDVRWREVFLITANMLDEADGFLLLMQQHINDFGKKHLEAFLRGVDGVINHYSHHNDTASRALVIYFLLMKYLHNQSRIKPDIQQSAAVQGRKIALDIARVDPEIRKHIDISDSINFVFDRAFSLFEAQALMKHIQGELLLMLQYYLQASELLLSSLKTECYISKQTREDIYDNLLVVI